MKAPAPKSFVDTLKYFGMYEKQADAILFDEQEKSLQLRTRNK